MTAAGRAGRTVVYTDGACSGNPGPGGWGWVIPDGEAAFGGAPDTTNQRMELMAVLEAARALPDPLHVVSDSTYVVNCFRDSWWKGWLKRDWKNSQKKPVANRDIWEPLIELYQERDITFEWVKGHSGDRWNERADELAVEGRSQYATSIKPASRSTAEPAKVKAKQGHRIAVVGHRPPEIGGYGDNETADAIRERLRAIIQAKASVDDDTVVYTGLQLGAEQLGAKAAIAAGVPFVVVLAFPDPAARWPKAAQTHFDELLDQAQDVIVLESAVPKTAADAGKAFGRRDKWLQRECAEALIVWDRADKAIGSLARSFESALGDDVWIVDPAEC